MWTLYLVNVAANLTALVVGLVGLWTICKLQDLQYEKRKREYKEKYESTEGWE